MASLSELTELLEHVIREPSRKMEHVKSFQAAVWDTKNLDAEPMIVRLLRDLACDLDFFEPDARLRANEPALYGEDRLEHEVRAALMKLASALSHIREP